jgi:transcriptional regulator with XRE-family HTH domain
MKVATHYRNQDVARAFGVTLRAARTGKGLSQEKLSQICDLDRTYPSLLERGLRGPTVAMLLRLADALGVAPAQLVIDTVQRLHKEAQW